MLNYKMIKLLRYNEMNVHKIEMYDTKKNIGHIKFYFNFENNNAHIIELFINYKFDIFAKNLLDNTENILKKELNIKKIIVLIGSSLKEKIIQFYLLNKYIQDGNILYKIL